MAKFQSTKVIDLGSCAFRQPRADSHCRWIHGYRLKAKFWFESENLDDNNWVVDFGGLKDLKRQLRNQFDHTLCLDRDDPALLTFQTLSEKDAADVRIMNGVGIELTAKWCYDLANEYLQKTYVNKNGAHCVKVEVWEHEGYSAIYGD